MRARHRSFHTMNTFMIYLICIASVGGALFGYDTGVVSGAMIQIKSDSKSYPEVDGMNLSNLWQEVVVSCTTAGAALGCILCGTLNDSLGRKPVNLMSALLFVASCAVMAAAPSLAVLVVGRTLVGVAIGFAATTVPMYLAEVAAPEERGRVVTVNNISIVGGQVVASLAACAFDVAKTPHGWRYMLALGGVPGLVMFVGFLFLPESPRWLAGRGRVDEARACLTKIREGDVEEELALLVEELQEEQGKAFSVRVLWNDKGAMRALYLGCGLQILQQLAGINVIMYYSATILQNTSGNSDLSPWDHVNVLSTCLSSAVAFAQMAGNIIGLVLIERCGRKPLVLGSLCGVIVFLVALGGVFVVKPSQALAATMMCCYLLSFGIGMAPIPWVFNAEVYPLYARSFCMSLSTFCNWTASFAVSSSFLTLGEAISTDRKKPKDHPDSVFWLYALCCIVGFLLLKKYMPGMDTVSLTVHSLHTVLAETQGLTLEQVSQLFRTGGYEECPRSSSHSDECHSSNSDSCAYRGDCVVSHSK